MRIVRRWLVPLGLGYVTLMFLVWLLQGCMVHFPRSELIATPADIGLNYEDLTITTVDDERLHGWYLSVPEARGVLLFLHGNAGNISHRLESLEIFRQLNLNVLIVDYRGYGRSSGRPSERGLKRDAEAALDYLLIEKNFKPGQIVAFGRSLGAALAADLGAHHQLAGVILESAFTSVADVGADLYPFLPVRLLVRYQYNTLESLKAVSAPVLVVHSPDDEIIPFAHGRKLYQSASEPRSFLTIQGSHNAGFLRSRDVYMAGLDDFLTRIFPSH